MKKPSAKSGTMAILSAIVLLLMPENTYSAGQNILELEAETGHPEMKKE